MNAEGNEAGRQLFQTGKLREFGLFRQDDLLTRRLISVGIRLHSGKDVLQAQFKAGALFPLLLTWTPLPVPQMALAQPVRVFPAARNSKFFAVNSFCAPLDGWQVI